MKKGFIFDADGTLLDSMKIWDEIVQRFLTPRGKVTNPELEKIVASMSIEEGVLYIKNYFSLNENPDEMKNEILGILDEFYRSEVELKTGVKEFLELCSKNKIPMCVASAGNTKILVQAFTRLGINQYFTKIYSCSDYGDDKHQPTIYLKCAEDFNSTPENMVVFEDALIPVRTAKNAGFYVVGIKDSFSSKDENKIRSLCDLFIEDFTELKLEEIL